MRLYYLCYQAGGWAKTGLKGTEPQLDKTAGVSIWFTALIKSMAFYT